MTGSVLGIEPIPHPLDATVRVPGSKSLTNRALLIAALADGQTQINHALFSDDTRHVMRALQKLGFELHLDESRCEMTVHGLGGIIPASKAELFIGNAGTAARFLSAFLTLGTGEFILDGGPRMRERPIAGLVTALNQLGARLEATNGCPPVKIIASGLRGGRTSVTGNISSQFLSAVLMVAPYARQPVQITLSTELGSRPYVEMTLAVMRDFGVDVQQDGSMSFTINSSCYGARSIYPIESDASAAACFFAAPGICGGRVRVEGISRKSVQGDVAFLDILEKMGCRIREGMEFLEVHAVAPLAGVDVNMRDIPDTAQTLAVIAPFAATPTRIRGIASARFKETDRIRATCTELARLGVHVEEHEDGMTIHPCEKFTPATIQTRDDHRMAMAFSLIGLRIPGISIADPACVSKTFPSFFDVLEFLR